MTTARGAATERAGQRGTGRCGPVGSRSRGRRRATALLVALLVLAHALALLASCGGGAGGAPASAAPDPPTDPGLSPEPVPEASDTETSAAAAPVVYLLGGSGARECVVSNADWGAELSRLADADVRAVDLGATNQSYTADRHYVCNMEDRPALVVIGVSLGRYTTPPPSQVECDKKLSPPLQAALDGEVEVEHRYTETRIKSDERKAQLLQTWLAERYPLFRKNYAANLDELEALLQACRERDYAAALLELPLDLEAAGDRFDTPRERYGRDCRRLAAKYQARWLSFVDDLRLPSTSFYDLAHLVEPGREAWQTRLSEEIAPLLSAGALR